MQVLRKTRRQTEYQLSQEEFQSMMKERRLRGAVLAETMGPNWKNLYWSPSNRPFVLAN